MPQDKKHSVKANLQVMELTRTGSAITLEVFCDESKIGTIEIGQGSFGWRPAKWKSFKKRNWSDFEAFMRQYW